ncbi:MAG: ATP-binding protein [Candidatus Omnitrophota bacterium]
MNEIKINSDQAMIRVVSQEILEYVEKTVHGIDKDVLFDIRLCIEEAVRNAMVHGNRQNKDLPVYVSYGVEAGKFMLTIEDHGSGFNPAKVPDPTADENLYKEGGRGVFIIHKLMDNVRYNEKGNRVTMEKSLN